MQLPTLLDLHLTGSNQLFEITKTTNTKDKTRIPETYLIILDNLKNISKKHSETLTEHKMQKENFGRFNKQDLQ